MEPNGTPPSPTKTLAYNDPGTQKTLGYNEPTPAPTSLGTAATIANDALAHTIAADQGPSTGGRTPTIEHSTMAEEEAPAPSNTRTMGRNTTVLPRVEGNIPALRVIAEPKIRYQHKKSIGAGGMGEVSLVEDQDIGRTVAVKRLLPEAMNPASLARFVDEVRVIGQLEHPNIVPIHDVGIDDEGRYFFVMKYLEGETLEHIIEKLVDGDPEYHRKYTFEQRTQLFMSLLRALQYAHTKGIVHRDLKPANVMVGRFGEVVLMDWGIARPVQGARDLGSDANETPEPPTSDAKATKQRLFATRHGALIGTPAYMSPEQARGQNEKIDARSDLYSAAVLFHELLGLRHYLAERKTMPDMIVGVLEQEPAPGWSLTAYDHPAQSHPPAELLYFAIKAMSKKPEDRFQTAAEMLQALQDTIEGKLHVQCHVTMTKRMTREFGRFVDRHPNKAFFAFVLFVVFSLSGAAAMVQSLLRS